MVTFLLALLAPAAMAQYFDQQALAAANPEAKSHLEKAFAARTAGDFRKTIEEYKAALTIQPDALDIHRAFLMDIGNALGMARFELSNAQDRQRKGAATPGKAESGKNESDIAALEIQVKQRGEDYAQLKAIYERWMKEHPEKAIYPYMLAKAMSFADCDKAVTLLEKAIALDPKFEAALDYMSEVQGWLQDKTASADYMKRLVNLKPGDDEVKIRYAERLRAVDRAAADKLLEEILARNPGNSTGVQAATELITAADTPEEKVAATERALKQFPMEKFKEMQRAIFSSLDAYAVVSPERGLELARTLQIDKGKQKDPYFQPRVDYLDAVVQSRAFTAAGRFDKAYAAIEKIEPPMMMKAKPLVLMKANAALKAGKADAAYGVLLKDFAETADPDIGAALAKSADALGKSQQDVSREVWAIRKEKEFALKDLPLKRMENDQQVRISDFRGKVVLVSVWHPG